MYQLGQISIPTFVPVINRIFICFKCFIMVGNNSSFPRPCTQRTQQTFRDLVPIQCLNILHVSGSYKYVHILVSLRNTSFKIPVVWIPNQVARKNLHTSQYTIFCPRHWCQSSWCDVPTKIHCHMAVERIEPDASRIHFGVRCGPTHRTLPSYS